MINESKHDDSKAPFRGFGGMNYTELQVTTNFSFLRGASHPEELVEQAAIYGYEKIAITDRIHSLVLFVHMLPQKRKE
jgi:DNA polymerase III alpha subunit